MSCYPMDGRGRDISSRRFHVATTQTGNAMTAKTKKRFLIPGLAVLGALLLSACRSNLPQDALSPQGPYARQEDTLFFWVFWIGVIVFVLVEGLLVYILFKFRHRPGRGIPTQVHGNTRLEIMWTIAPAVLLAAIAVPTIVTIFSISARPAGALPIRVVGHQWWWEVRYPTMRVTTANEIHIPAGRPVDVSITSNDVIHSFWVPKLAGKQDLEPGRTNHVNLQADRPGVYLGQCAEYCGLSHANMRLRVIADRPADFQAWATAEGRPAPPPPPEVMEILQAHGCGGCHTIDGVPGFVGTIGPDLTHFGGRGTLAGSILENTPADLALWLRDPPLVKPGADMPNLHLTPDEIRTLVAYLRSQK
jgi:cytochrome c oxidase subunit II